MIIYPALDLRQGKCVRLYQGDFQQATIYHADPFAMAKAFVTAGTKWLHIVDLDGAKDPQQNQTPLIIELIKASDVSVQTGGGIRSAAQIEKLLNQGAARIIIGSLAVRNPTAVMHWLKTFGAEHIVLALDIIFDAKKEPRVAMNAWQTVSDSSLFTLIEQYATAGLKHVLCTNIARDGTLAGPDYELYQTLLTRFPFLHLQASGGIHALADLQLLRQNQAAGAIIGRALYENKFTLAEALAC